MSFLNKVSTYRVHPVGVVFHPLKLFTSSQLSSSSNHTAKGIPICHNSDAFGGDIRETGWGWGVGNQAGDWLLGKEVKQKAPRQRRKQQAGGFPCNPMHLYAVRRVKAEQGRRETEDFMQDSTSTHVPGACSVSASATTNGSLLRARSTAEWNSLLVGSRDERTSPIVEKTSSTIASAISA